MTTLTLYTGSKRTGVRAQLLLDRWCRALPAATIQYASIHDDPAAAIRLGIHELPALVAGDQVVAQGPPAAWLNAAFLDKLAARVRTMDTG